MEERKNMKGDKKDKEEGVVYRVNIINCDKIYIGETKLKMKKRIEEHKKDVDFKRISNSVIAKHVDEFNHEIGVG